ncbi:ADP-ribosyltransferase domain-containing protein [Mesorhizobium erdmanii]|uniref:ADP-ribosyltransferase domain-containing protein n=1 Tax=Mesorhizobium erdmanii TaxID=1777866 RepID=UPI000478ECE8|nr:ADP-ribosyltransferase domain-containing protein [Mesorhizobium erdmanii]
MLAEGGKLIDMNGGAFLECVAKIVGTETAERYATRFGDLDKPYTEAILGYEALAFYVYSTGVAWHDHINGALWKEKATPEILQFKGVLNHALGKLPPYVLNGGLVYRGYHTLDVDAFAARYDVGQVIRFPGFTSAAVKENEAYFGNVLFTIRALTAHRIWFLAAEYDENEVLLPAGQSFQIVEVVASKGKAAIFLDELP